MPRWNAINFQQANRVIIEQASYFHDFSLTIISLILVIIGWTLVDLIINTSPLTDLREHPRLEVWWTVLPRFILISLALPSLWLLYLIDEVGVPELSVNVLGHQWFWEYNYPDFEGCSFESYIISNRTRVRLIEVDNRVVLPYNCSFRILISSTDVLHSWAMPTLGVKADATPGRLNQINLRTWASGLFYGQCSEICGANHSFIPIVLEVISPSSFIKWLTSWNS